MKTLPLLASVALLATSSPLLAETVADIFRITGGSSTTQANFHPVEIPKGGEHVLADLEGPGKITYFYITDDTVGKWYPGLVLKIHWDESKDPSIEIPLADFFGAIGGKATVYESSFMQVNQACFMCYLPMPFSKRARFVLHNDGDRDYRQKVAYGIDSEQDPAFAQEKSRLHASWRRGNPVKGGRHLLMEAEGRGHYVGGFLQAVSRQHHIWFGEGDTIFTIDGRNFVHSPGTEDEYGSCWASPAWPIYNTSVCGHVLNDNGVNRMYRWYLANPARFQKGIKVEIQNEHLNGTPTSEDADDYTSVAFWYQEDNRKATPLPSFEERQLPSFDVNGKSD